jgi:Epoxide hydrolase N terminus
MATTVQVPTNIRPFHVDIPDEKLADLRRRIAATRWPSAELVNDSSQGVQSKMLQKLARYWEKEYDWRKVEKKLNALPQFSTTIDGLEIHVIHVKSRHKDAMPLIITHGGQIGIRDRHAEVHRLAAGNCLMHRIQIEQIANHDLRTHVAQRLCAFVFSSHHRTHRFAVLQQQFSDRTPYRADTARRAGDQNGICHVPSYALANSYV